VFVGIDVAGIHEGVEIQVRTGSKCLGHATGQIGQRTTLA
jgi:hypothetical protein